MRVILVAIWRTPFLMSDVDLTSESNCHLYANEIEKSSNFVENSRSPIFVNLAYKKT